MYMCMCTNMGMYHESKKAKWLFTFYQYRAVVCIRLADASWSASIHEIIDECSAFVLFYVAKAAMQNESNSQPLIAVAAENNHPCFARKGTINY